MVISEYNSQVTLEFLTKKRENQYFERKGLYDNDIKPTKIANELIGMLNADGGVLAFGVSDAGEIQDLNILGEKLSDYRNLFIEFIEPHGNVYLEEVDINGNLVFLYHVDQDIERIFKRKDNEQIYLRVDDKNKTLNRDAVRALEYDKQIRKFEDEIEPEFDFNDLDLKLLNGYKEKLNFEGNVHDLLVKRHLAIKKNGEIKIKKAGVLLFAKDPEKYITSASLRYLRYEGTEAKVGTEHNVVKDQRFENNIPWIIGKVREFLKTTFKEYHFLDLETGRFNKVPEYPEEAWLEGVVNAVCHRSYNIHGNSIYIKHFDDRIEISNSGPLPAQVTIENIRTERFSRNPRIARVLGDMGFVRELNEGVARIYQSMEKSMLSKPEYIDKNGTIILILRNKVSNHTKTIPDVILKLVQSKWKEYNPTQRKILHFLFFKNLATVDELSEHAEINEKTIRLYLNQFIDEDKILERLSNKKRDKNAKYAFRKD